jgi:cystine transport system ATP-binding protein
MIGLSGIEKHFGDNHVLKGVSVAVPEGGVTALIGASGSGKSTLLRCVNLLEIPQAGEVQIEDTTVRFAPGHKVSRDEILSLRRKTGMVFQNFQLFPHRTVLENVMEGLITVLGWPSRGASREPFSAGPARGPGRARSIFSPRSA